jgi:tRNA-2-methylthio-N6-dimethylallyladenosine synthase
MNPPLKKLYVKTYGCQMNVYDSDRMAQLLTPHGYALTDTPEEANIAIINTCHIREKATEKTFSEVGRFKKYREKKRKAGEEGLLVVAGCVAQAEGAEIMRRAPYVDVVVGPQAYHRLPEMIARAKRSLETFTGDPQVIDTDFPVESKFDHLPLPNSGSSLSSFLSIQEGCDKFCAFCVVPYTRGAEYSRPAAEILKEAEHLVAQGVKEITLLGQNVSAYKTQSPQGGTWGIGALCLEISAIEGLERIRYTTSHPRDMMDPDLIEAHRSCPKLMPFLHLPVQSGSDRILEAMNRKHTAKRYEEVIQVFREARPDIGFSSDFIVGFPGETEEDFEDTLNLIRKINYAQAYSFKYSPRPGTPAAALDLQVPTNIQDKRLEIIQDLLFKQQREFNNSFIGKTVPVLVEKLGIQKNQYLGKSPHQQSVQIESSHDIVGKIVNINITDAGLKVLVGRPESGL